MRIACWSVSGCATAESPDPAQVEQPPVLGKYLAGRGRSDSRKTMLDEDCSAGNDEAEELLRRALLDDSAGVAVSLRVGGMPLSDAVTVIFHGRRDLGTLQTYVTCGSRGAGTTVAASELMGADVVVDHSVQLSVRLPAYRLLPTALLARDAHLVVTPVCGARTLAEGQPPLGIACAQQDLTRVYPLADDPERCVEDFLALAAEHARELAERLDHQEASVERFLELSREDPPGAA